MPLAQRDDTEQELNPRSIRDLLGVHNFFQLAIESGVLTEEEEMLCMVYHDALCWALGNRGTRLPGMVKQFRQLVRTERLRRVEPVSARVH